MDIMEVILVDENDKTIGVLEKMEAHEKGLLHRAFSIFIFNEKGEMLLQQRALDKYHSGGLWTNACCSHPSPGEHTHSAALRRLQEELGFQTTIQKAFDFLYKADFDNGLTEHEFDHVFIGRYDGDIDFCNKEVMAVTYKSMEDINKSLQANPEQYTAWFKIAFPMLEEWLHKQPEAYNFAHK